MINKLFILVILHFVLMIVGVKVLVNVWKKDERGRLAEILRSDNPDFKGFGQAYLTVVNPGFAKAWHLHQKQTDSIFCVKGKMRLVLYDARSSSKTFGEVQEFLLVPEEPVVVQIPPGIYHGFESLTDGEAAMLNIPDRLYDYKNPDEIRLPFDTGKIPFRWNSDKGG